MVNVADEVVKVWQPTQFMSFIKSVKKQMGRQGLAKASVQINLLFTSSGKKKSRAERAAEQITKIMSCHMLVELAKQDGVQKA